MARQRRLAEHRGERRDFISVEVMPPRMALNRATRYPQKASP